ncbi:hypothetical protein OO17_10385 [Rhodopseudomonas palustris]|uniref:SGNH/GDSL hydrolase family protein n=1 Tax=Rhodopseudomonas palustris TaxID=1076 RepID=A0A0D7ETA0_RHOPL|nr:hypothetical protein OO17_10385 [Rhodopseudomonas palustris]
MAAIELGMRAAGYGAVQTLAYGRANYNSDLPEVGYAGRPNARGVQSNEGMSHVRLNSHGFNDVEHEFHKPRGAFRLMVVGNSYSMALQSDRKDGYVERLGADLQACPALVGRNIETINLGVDGFTIHQQYLMLRDYGMSLAPDFILLQTNSFVVPGDLDPLRNLSPRLERRPDGSLTVDYSYLDLPEFKLKSSAAAALLQAVSDQSRLVQYVLQYRRANAQAALSPAKTPPDAANDAATYQRYQEGRDLAFLEMAKLAQAHDARFAVAVTPDADALSSQPFEPNPLRREWAALAAQTNTPFFDVEEQARAHVRATGAYLHGFGAQSGSGHLNRNGNAFFASALAPKICALVGHPRTAMQLP